MLASSEPVASDSSLNGVSATRPALTTDAFAVVLAAHRREGYDAGYRRAIADVLAASVFVAEKALLTAADPNDARQAMYRFIELLERETLRNARSDRDFTDGAGI